MKALLLRVGIDKAYGALSPVFEDLTYKYIPIYYRDIKELEQGEWRTYHDLGLSSYLPEKIYKNRVHLDPEFESFTYGDPGKLKRASLLKLSKGDILVFYIGGRFTKQINNIGCFMIGYFIIDKIVDWNQLPKTKHETVKSEFAKNAHIISSKSKVNLVLVKGSKQSKQLKHCIPITSINKRSKNPPYITSSNIQKILGIRSFIIRSVPIWIQDEKYLKSLKRLLGIK